MAKKKGPGRPPRKNVVQWHVRIDAALARKIERMARAKGVQRGRFVEDLLAVAMLRGEP